MKHIPLSAAEKKQMVAIILDNQQVLRSAMEHAIDGNGNTHPLEAADFMAGVTVGITVAMKWMARHNAPPPG
jgi:hypothetical protein